MISTFQYPTVKIKQNSLQSVAVRPDLPEPDELAPLLSDQHALLQHLEGQVNYYKVGT